MKKKFSGVIKRFPTGRHKTGVPGFGIQAMIMSALTTITIVITVTLGSLLFNSYSRSLMRVTLQDTDSLMDRTAANLQGELLNMRNISNTANYDLIHSLDVKNPQLQQQLGLLYEASRDSVVSIAIYSHEGSLIMSEPSLNQKEDPNVTRQSWFMEASQEIENMHFSMPHIQNLFQNASDPYHWVISVSQSVDLTDGEDPSTGVLLVDMDYGRIKEILDQINETEDGKYYYLCNQEGDLIYHPRLDQINRGLDRENSKEMAARMDGSYKDVLKASHRHSLVKTISYTGWKLVGVVPNRAINSNMKRFRYFILTAGGLLLMMLLCVNRIVARRISMPILKLNRSVRAYEAGEKPNIYVGGSAEIRYLGRSVQKSYEEIDHLMKQILEEQNQRRKSEIAALQSQINPHFLYNTLDSITWMVEGGKNDEAVMMISQLARLLRISLSKGHTIISIRDEIAHCESYMKIQRIRYKNRFAFRTEIDPEILDYSTVKLVLQPLLENAIYYGVGDMDEDDGGEILVTGRLERDTISLTVSDNGNGMTKEELEHLLESGEKVPKHGSGVGVINVHNRIQLLFGPSYGITAESEPDEGTSVTIHLPAVFFTPEKGQEMESQMKVRGNSEG